MQKKFLIIGRSGTGKTTLAKGAAERLGLTLLKSYCTRSPRNGEDNPDHIFISPSEVESYRSRMIAYTDKVDEYERFATIDQLKESDIYIIDPNGVDYLSRLDFPEFEDMKFIRIYIRVPFATNIKRLRERGDDTNTYLKRFEQEDRQFREFEREQKWDYHILNIHNIEDGIDDLSKIIEKELNI